MENILWQSFFYFSPVILFSSFITMCDASITLTANISHILAESLLRAIAPSSLRVSYMLSMKEPTTKSERKNAFNMA